MKINVCSVTILIILQVLGAQIFSYRHNGFMKWYKNEQRLLKKLQKSIKRIEYTLKFFERRLREVSVPVIHEVDKNQYLSHPLNNFALVKRLAIDWPNITVTAVNLSIPTPKLTPWPGRQGLITAMRTLARLQQTYLLRTVDLARGSVQGDPADIHVTGMDCFLMAVIYCQLEEAEMASQWLNQALVKHDVTITSANLIDVNLLAGCLSEDSPGSVAGLLVHFPTFQPSIPVLDTWKIMNSMQLENQREQYEFDEDNMVMCKMCRVAAGSSLQPQHVLTCRYVHYNKTRLRMSPFRVEELQLDPPVLLFHDVISDAEIREVQKCAISKLKVSNVTSDRGGSHVTHDRSRETAVVPPGASSLLDRLDRRMGDMTNLDISTSEMIEVSRYSVGGECIFHRDFPLSGKYSKKEDRIATLIIYLSEVPRGGHTVFERWGLSVRPQKRSALFWFNLHPIGTADYSSELASCPVVRGIKWVLNKWFYKSNSNLIAREQQASFKYFYI